MKLISIIAIALASLTYSAFAADLSLQCQKKVLLELKRKSITPTTEITQDYGTNLAPLVGAVCKDKNALKINRIDKNTFLITAIVKPHAGYDETGLRVTCDREDIKKQPINTIVVKADTCTATLTNIDFYFDLND